ncbi:hypothetical protein H4219_004836 [Mycoemilia scoparia]|uniref:Uncharacterized protein n=1 Tax=Mycoemilia scoparia TaxID=417184 RepID=A0A9W7ZZW0_9FUNG|nr:hypothetical protein H4219_004836 [Mycoemilia scoparia]
MKFYRQTTTAVATTQLFLAIFFCIFQYAALEVNAKPLFGSSGSKHDGGNKPSLLCRGVHKIPAVGSPLSKLLRCPQEEHRGLFGKLVGLIKGDNGGGKDKHGGGGHYGKHDDSGSMVTAVNGTFVTVSKDPNEDSAPRGLVAIHNIIDNLLDQVHNFNENYESRFGGANNGGGSGGPTATAKA